MHLGTRRAHSSLCRKRIYDLMAEDPEEIDRMIAADERLGRAQPREELTRRAKQGFPPDPKDVAKTPSAPRTRRGATDVAEQMSQAGTPTVLEP